MLTEAMYEELQLAPIEFVGPFTEEEKQQLIDALMGVIDPEIGMDIVNLGLVYELHKDESNRLKVVMTLTAVGCPLAPVIVGDVRRSLLGLEKYDDVEVELVYSPPWDRTRLSRVAKMALGLY
ncbi:metal-sulfur cluster biosynthetic enzyme [Brockia lithotrophica]|uniref:Metal-sulfur cluster biosynthetic enzyme n=2 Tax=Brockia lithotrophica TaxID=933949 RepID=A0A660L4K6_9BACL|nr:metal-sulfur cluster biosynthetic enzyme [Brockia lithotrophica]